MKIERVRSYIARVREQDVELELHYLYRGVFASIVKRLVEDSIDSVKKGECACAKIMNSIVCVCEDSAYQVKVVTEEAELELSDELIDLVKYCVQEAELIPEFSGDEVRGTATFYIYLSEALDKYSQLRLDTALRGTKQLITHFCSYCPKPWILRIIDLETFVEVLYASENFARHLERTCQELGIAYRDVFELLQHIHSFSHEFATFLVTVLDIPDAVFVATVTHHGKERAHKYTINIPPEVQEKLALSPGTKVEVRLKVLK